MQPQQVERLAGTRCFACELIGHDEGIEGIVEGEWVWVWPVRSQCPLAQHWMDEQQAA